MRNGSSRRVSLAIAATTVTAAMACAPSALAGTAGTGTRWQVNTPARLGRVARRGCRSRWRWPRATQSALRRRSSPPHAALTPAQFNARFALRGSTVDRGPQLGGRQQPEGQLGLGQPDPGHAHRLLQPARERAAHRLRSLQLGRQRHLLHGRPGRLTCRPSFASRRERRARPLQPRQGQHPRPVCPLGRRAERGQGRLASRGLPSSLNYPATYGPAAAWSLYDAPSSQTGSGQQLSIITEGDVSQPKKDLATFEQHFGLPTVTWNQINVGTPSTDTSGDDEWDLDSQYSTGFAPGVTSSTSTSRPSLDDRTSSPRSTEWVTDDSTQQGSFSAGECDILADAAGFTTGLDAVLKQADAQGQTMFFSSGDTGSQCPAIVGDNGVPAGIPDTNYPASSPYGIGVGGTSVLDQPAVGDRLVRRWRRTEPDRAGRVVPGQRQGAGRRRPAHARRAGRQPRRRP